MADPEPARLIGINHVALAVSDLEAALEFYGTLLAFEIRGRTESAAFLDAGDQFIALVKGDGDGLDGERHVGLVVDDSDAVEDRLVGTGAELLETDGLDFRDPWGNRIQIVAYDTVQFTKAAHVREAMGVDGEKTADALAQLEAKGMAPD